MLSAVLLIGFKAANKYVPHEHLPWQALDINAPIGLATKSQLLRLAMSPKTQCASMMQRDAVHTDFDVLPPRSQEGDCGWEIGFSLTRNNDITFRPSTIDIQCPMSAASYIWLDQISDIAFQTFGSKLIRVHQYGSYTCRNIAGTSRRSEHAFANAWDVSGFELADGRVISVLKDWDGADSRKAFLRRARDTACGLFRVVLSPDYNAAHADHFHLDMGPSTSCH